MQVKEPGHIYSLTLMDTRPGESPTTELAFLNREEGTEHSGVNTQEVLRALIDRIMHCDNRIRWEGNDLIIYHLRMALALQEARALLRKTHKGVLQPENIAVGKDGHFSLTSTSTTDDYVHYILRAEQDRRSEGGLGKGTP